MASDLAQPYPGHFTYAATTVCLDCDNSANQNDDTPYVSTCRTSDVHGGELVSLALPSLAYSLSVPYSLLVLLFESKNHRVLSSSIVLLMTCSHTSPTCKVLAG